MPDFAIVRPLPEISHDCTNCNYHAKANSRFSGRKKARLFSNTLHWCHNKILLAPGLSLTYHANITFPAPFSTSCLHITKSYTFFHISFDFCSPSAPAFPKTPHNVWNNVTMQQWYQSFIFPHLLCTVSLLHSALAWWDQKIWSCHCERKLLFKTTARANYFPKFSLRSFWLLWSPFQEVKHILQADDSGSFASYSEGFANYGKVISFSAIAFLEITNPLIFCLRQYLQLASKEFIWMRHIISFQLGKGITTVTKSDLQDHFWSPQDFAEAQTQNNPKLSSTTFCGKPDQDNCNCIFDHPFDSPCSLRMAPLPARFQIVEFTAAA